MSNTLKTSEFDKLDYCSLEEVVDILDGQRKPIKQGDRISGNIPYYGATGVIDFVNDYIFDDDLVLVGEDGENIKSRVLPMAFKISGKSWVNNHAHVLKPHSINLDFLMQYLNIIDYTPYITGTAQPKLNQQSLRKIKILNLPLAEQQKIAEILSSVDAAIEKTEQVITKTEEIKKGLMQQLLTKGIGHTEFKQTEIGEIPVEWNLMKIEEFTSVKTGGTPSKKQQSYWENGNIPWMSSGEIHKKYIRDVDEYITIEGYNNSNVSILPKGAVMMALNGQGKTRGTVAILETETTCNQSLAAILPNDTVNEYFLYHLLDSKYQELRAITGDGARTGLNLSLIRNIIIQVPSIKEQLKIVQIINAIDVKLQSEKKNQKKLEVLKTALMQQLLTGKTRVKID